MHWVAKPLTWAIYLEKVNTLRFWLKLPAEGKCPHILILITSKKWMQNALRFPIRKKGFAPLTNNFWSFKIRIKRYLSKRQNFFFFIRNLRAFCIYFLQVLKIRIWGHLPSAGIACKIYLLMPSNFDEKNALWLWLILPSENDGIYDN